MAAMCAMKLSALGIRFPNRRFREIAMIDSVRRSWKAIDWRCVIMAVVAGTTALGAANVARAHDDDDDHYWKKRKHRYYAPYYAAPPVRYYAPPPVVYVPPPRPVVVYPQPPIAYEPVYPSYGGGGNSINITVPLR
jgi:hypothetical protein